MKEKIKNILDNKVVPFLKSERGYKAWVVIAIAITSFFLGAFIF